MIAMTPTNRCTSTEREVAEAFQRGPHARLDVGHSRLAYWRFGRGPDVVLVHGWPLHAATFRRVVPLLAPALTLHVFDLPGVGKTESDRNTSFDLPSLVAATRKAIDALGLARYSFLAHDSGGTIARFIAAEDEHVSGLALVDTEIPRCRPSLVRVLKFLAQLPGARRWMFAAMRSRAVRRSSFLFGGCFTDPAYVDGDFSELFVRPLLTSGLGRGQGPSTETSLRSAERSQADCRQAHQSDSGPLLHRRQAPARTLGCSPAAPTSALP